MNAPAPHTAQLELLPLASIAPSSTHIQQLRRKRFDKNKLQELAASLVDVGMLEPILVRPHPAPSARVKYEIVAGERRYHAAGLARMESIPALVRPLDTAKVIEIQLIENLQREDLHPLEEAEGYRELMKEKQSKAEEVAALVGKSRSWIYSRLNLLALEGPARAALEDGRLDVSRALVVATVAQPNQRERALALALQLGSNNKPIYSVRELRQQIVDNKLSLPLVGAPFDKDDAGLLPKAGACGSCPRRTGNCDPEAIDPDVCTDLACFHLKVAAAGARKVAAAEQKGVKILKGDAARKLSPSVKTVYDHVDLDLVCEFDEFPEKEPTPPKGIDEYSDEWRESPAFLAWSQRERLWQKRTYRALLAGAKLEPVMISDPKTGQLRELLPFKQARELLKKRGIDLPSYANRRRPSFQRSSTSGETREKAESPEAKAKREREVEIQQKIDERLNLRVLQAARAKYPKRLGRPELQRLAARFLIGVEDVQTVADLWKWPQTHYWRTEEALKRVSTLSEAQLGHLMLDIILADALYDGRDDEAKRFKIDTKVIAATVEREVRQELEPKNPVAKAWPFPTKAAKPKTKAKKATKGKKK